MEELVSFEIPLSQTQPTITFYKYGVYSLEPTSICESSDSIASQRTSVKS